MPTKPSKVLVIGSGPIVIGQAAEFDYAGTQACKSLREEGITTVLVNSNPATIMTDEDIADIVYIEPLTVPVIERIIAKERPEGLLPNLGGQTALNLAVELAEAGILEKYNVKLMGSNLRAIKYAEDRDLFRNLLIEIGEPVPPSETVNNMEQARKALTDIGLPLVIRPAFTLGGTGGGIANNVEEYLAIVQGGMDASPIHQVLVERSLVGWKELEYEVMRDGADNCITICNMENIDPMGVHTGDSIVVAPSQTLTDKEYQMLRTSALKIIRELGIEGGCNVQFALAPGDVVGKTLPDDGQKGSPYFVIEVNPRVSRSSALASKATGYPIARVAAKIAIGKRLDEIPNAVTKKTVAAFEPALDYCVVKIPRWPFDKFPTGNRKLGTQMKATGEVMAIDRTFEAAFQKAVRSLEIGSRSLLWEDSSWKIDKDAVEAKDTPTSTLKYSDPELKDLPLHPTDERLWALMYALRRGVHPETLSRITGIDPWFTRAFLRITKMEERLMHETVTRDLLWQAKRMGFSDRKIGVLSDRTTDEVRTMRGKWGIRPVYKMVDTCAAEFEAHTPYFYSSYEQENEAEPMPGAKAIVVGSGPIRIGQGIEFDYCSVHAAWALQKEGVKSVLVNSNPETVSTDFDTTDRLYFEPLDEESVRDIIENETGDAGDSHSLTSPSTGEVDPDASSGSGEGEIPATMVQFGGQTAINLSQGLDKAGLPILGSSAASIDTASDRHLFEEFLARIGIPNPPGAAVVNLEQALVVAQEIGYPVLVRPSYVLGGRAMEVVQNATELVKYMAEAQKAGEGRRVLIDKYFAGREVEVDAVCDGETVLIPGIMEQIERAGVHSGDSMAIYPGLTLTEEEVNTVVDYTTRIGLALGVRGLMNIQYVVVGGSAYRSPDRGRGNGEKTEVYVIEVNPRSSRTIPFISKVTGVPMVRLAVNAMLGKTLKEQGYKGSLWKRQKLVAIKAPVFSMQKLVGVDTYLGPEMKSTGEVMGIDYEFRPALAKTLMAAGLMLKPNGAILLSLSDRSKAEAVPMIKDLHAAGYKMYATEGTAAMIAGLGMPVEVITKRLDQGHPNVLDVIIEGKVNAVVNTVTGDRATLQDGFKIRRTAAERRIPCFTSLDTARAAAESLANGAASDYNIKPLPEYRKGKR
ncbi:MAG: carbamoyl-phosphate synthase large subunit [SAR202 cluster bacterium]|nr:carbamoyl-phosphate synthase large subunit [SAR202 cluster bacterium]